MSRRALMVIAAVTLAVSACTASQAAAPTSPSTTSVGSPVTTLAPLPLTTTTTAPLPSTTTTTVYVAPEPSRRRLVVNGIGDVNLDPGFVFTLSKTGYADAWTGVFGAFQEDDLTIANLECSPSDQGRPWNKPWVFRCDPDALPSMAEAGIDIANLANNHGMDYGMDAMLDGKENLKAVGIIPVGTGANRAEAYEPAVVEINGWTVAVIGSGGVYPESGTWVATDERPGMTNGDDTESIAAAVRKAKETADIVLVTAHWGKQYETRPQPFEIGQAEAWIDAGADGVFGHHQHRLQELGFYKGKPIAFGLSNFVWIAFPEAVRATAVAQFVFEPDGTVGACLIPAYIERHGHPVIQDPEAPVCAPTTAPGH